MANLDEAKEDIANVLWDAMEMAEDWCKYEDYTYTFGDLLTLAKMIVDKQEKIANENK